MQLNKQNILELEHKLIDAIIQSNIEFLDQVLHDDLLFMIPDGTVITKAMDMESHKRGDMVVEYLKPCFEEINLFDDVAVVVVVYDTKGEMLGNPVEGNFRYIRVWKEFSDGLKVIGGSCIMVE